MNKYSKIKSIILPSKKINIFIVCVLFMGIIMGSIYAGIIGINDKTLVIEKIKLFIDNINNNKLDNLVLFTNSISINLIYIIVIWILGISLLGIIFNIFIFFIKSFIFGFSIASFIITYSYKGLVLSLIYLLFGDLLNIVILLIITIYSLMASKYILSLIFKNNNINIKRFLKNYILILLFSIIISIISSVSETFLLPAIIKLIIRLYV